MKALPTAIITQKNKIASSGSWLLFLDIAYPSLTASPRTHYRFVNNNENVTLGGNSYTKWAFGLGQVRETIKGDLPRVTLSLYDVNLTLRPTLQANDGWSGGEASVQRAYVTEAGVATDADIIQYFTILDTVWDDSRNLINFNLGISTPLNKRLPRHRYVSTVCRHKFRDGFCRYGETGEDGDVTTVYTECVPKGHYSNTLAYIAVGVAEAYTDFSVGQKIRLEGTTNNDDETYIISSITQDESAAAYLTLTSDFDLVYESHWNDGTSVRILAVCDYGITICRANNNSHQYGGSPGVSEGLYG